VGYSGLEIFEDGKTLQRQFHVGGRVSNPRSPLQRRREL
jgi:hypothetical protein